MYPNALRRTATVAVAVLSSVALLAGCATSGGSESDDVGEGTIGIIGNQPSGGEPVSGGTLSYASASPVTTLDPIKGRPSGFLGGTEMAAIYDLLMRYDWETRSYQPQLAESLSESADNLTWTLKLRPGVTFSDGSPLDAAAVVSNTNRFTAGKGSGSELFAETVTSVEPTDQLTVIYSLNRPWKEFPATLVAGYGLVVADSSYAGENFTPIGAGAFTMEKFTPGSEIVLKPRADYWGGKPNIDELKFVDIQGEQPKVEALRTGGIQMTYLRNADSVAIAAAEFPGYYEAVNTTEAVLINTRENRPGSDLRVRQAISLAMDPVVINQRARAGAGEVADGLFQSWSNWFSESANKKFDPDAARTLLDEAKAQGYDGKLTYVTPQNIEDKDIALAVQSMLQTVGFTVDIQYISSTTDLVKTLFVTHDFDLSGGGWGVSDDVPLNRLYGALATGTRNNIGAYSNPDLDKALVEAQTATNDEERKAAFATVQTVVNDSVPFVPWAAGANFVPWRSNVHGVVVSTDGLALFDKVWISD